MARQFVKANSQYGQVSATLFSSSVYPFTIAAWFQTTNPTIGVNQNMILAGTSGNNNNNIGIGIDNSNGEFQGYVSTGSGSFATIDVAGVLTANKWYAGVYVGASSTSRIAYVAGNSATDTTSSAFGASPSQITIGAYSGGTISDFVDGPIAECALWNVALTPLEVAAYQAGVRAYTIRPGALVGYWPLDGIASPEPDLSGKANNLTLTAGPALAFGPPFAPFTPRWPLFVPPIVPPIIPLSTNLPLGLASCEW